MGAGATGDLLQRTEDAAVLAAEAHAALDLRVGDLPLAALKRPSAHARQCPEVSARRVSRGYLSFTVAASGAGILMLEILGARAAGPVFGVSLFIWTALLVVTLASLATGYWAGGILSDRRPSPDVAYGLLLAAGGFTALVPLVGATVLVHGHAWLGLRVGVLASSFVLFFPPLTLLGALSPFAIKLGAKEWESAGRTAGTLYAISTVGSAAGAIAVGYFLVPELGVKRSFVCVTITILAPAIGWFGGVRRVATLVALVVFVGLTWTRKVEAPRDMVVVAVRDGAVGQVLVLDRTNGRRTRWLVLEGVVQTAVDRDSQTLESEYSTVMASFLAHHPRPRAPSHPPAALLIGLGGGALVHPLRDLGYDLDVVEIDPTVSWFAEEHFGCRREDYRLFAEDGRSYLRQPRRRYDVILFDVFGGAGQPSHLATREAFEEARAALAPDGILGMNVAAFPRGSNPLARSIAATASAVLPHRAVFIANPDAFLEDVHNMLMFFSPAPFDDADPGAALPAAVISRAALEQRRFGLDMHGATIVTDDVNPVDRWAANVNEAWRAWVFERSGVRPF